MSGTTDKYLSAIRFSDLAGWSDDDHAAALSTWALSCREIIDHGRSFSRKASYAGRRQDWLDPCTAALKLAGSADRQAARTFFERNFTPVLVSDPNNPIGLFTGYFEPEVAGSRTQSADYTVPVYARPKDLVAFNAAQRKKTGLKYGRIVAGKPRAYLSRQKIESGALAGKGLEIAWLKSPVDAFFMHVQGSGRVRLPDGKSLRLGFAGKSGLPYTSIGAVLIKRGEVTREQMSMQAIRRWMADNPDGARRLMWHNKSFIFFRELKLDSPALGPLGAQQVQLTPQRSLAVDRRFWALGTPMWLETSLPQADNTTVKFHRLMVAQDTGSAIRNRIRGDIFFGAGDQAAQRAGHMKHPGRLIALMPRAVVRRLGLKD